MVLLRFCHIDYPEFVYHLKRKYLLQDLVEYIFVNSNVCLLRLQQHYQQTSTRGKEQKPGSECSFGLLDFWMNANPGWRAWDSAGRLSITRVTIENHQSNNWRRKKAGCISISPQTTAVTENKKEESCNIILRHTLHSSKRPVSTPVCMSLWKMAKCVNSLHWTRAGFLPKHWTHCKSKGRQMRRAWLLIKPPHSF